MMFVAIPSRPRPILPPDSLLMVVAEDDAQALESDAEPIPGIDIPEGDEGGRASEEISAEQLKAYLEKLRPEDFGKFSP